MRLPIRIALATLAVLTGVPIAHAQPGVLTSAQLIEYTPDWTGERFPDGRPKVPDAVLDRVAKATLEEAWAVVTQAGPDGPVRAVLGGAGSRPHALKATANLLQLPDVTEAQLRAAIGSDLVTFFPDLDAYQTRMHTANILRAVREMRT